MNIEINKSNITLEKALEHGISSEEWEKIFIRKVLNMRTTKCWL